MTRIDLADPDQMEVIASLRLHWTAKGWAGWLTYAGKKTAVTCEEE